MSADSSCVLVFVKSPVAGRTKTRLAGSIGYYHAVNLYRCFVMDITKTISQTPFQVVIFCHPPGSEIVLKDWLGDAFEYDAQTGADLGMKMARAFKKVFDKQFDRAVLIGSDIPDLPEQMIHQAFLNLETHDAVVGPAYDGGFYLIGFRSDSFDNDIFDGILWSRDTVFAQMSERLSIYGLQTCLLPRWRDVDTYSDLKDLSDALLKLESFAGETLKYLKQSALFS